MKREYNDILFLSSNSIYMFLICSIIYNKLFGFYIHEDMHVKFKGVCTHARARAHTHTHTHIYIPQDDLKSKKYQRIFFSS